MKKLVLAITIILTFASFSNAQEGSFNDDIVKYLEINGTEKQYAGAVNELFSMLSRRYAHNNISQSVWLDLKEKYMEKSMKSIKFLLVTPYRTTFSHDNIKRMIAFYETDAGKQMLIDPTALSTEQKSVAGDFYMSDAGAKLLENKEMLEQKVSEVSEIWSRDLYKMVTDDLAIMGYSVSGN